MRILNTTCTTDILYSIMKTFMYCGPKVHKDTLEFWLTARIKCTPHQKKENIILHGVTYISVVHFCAFMVKNHYNIIYNDLLWLHHLPSTIQEQAGLQTTFSTHATTGVIFAFIFLQNNSAIPFGSIVC